MHRSIFESEHEDFRASVRTFVARHVAGSHERWREQRLIDREAWREAGRHDFLGIGMPEEAGGSGVDDYRYAAVLTEELAAVGLAIASSFGIHTDVVAPYLAELGTPQQLERWGSAFCSGDLITAIAMTEPAAGSDLAGIQTRARRVGGDWRLSGSKTFITNGMSADLVLVAARTGERSRDLTLFAVEAGTPGFERGRKLQKAGQPEADTAELFFDDVRLSDAEVIGEVDGGFRAMMARLPQERLHTACANLSHARSAFLASLDHVRDRRAFGQPIGTFQNSRFLLAEIDTELDVAQSFVDYCLSRRIAGRLDPIEAAKAKWWSAETQNKVIDACVQLHGGYGYMTEYEVTRAWLDARVSKIWAGSNEIMKEVIGRGLGLGDRGGAAEPVADRAGGVR